MLAQRVLAAIVGLPVLLALAWAGGWPFATGVALLGVIGWHELAGMLAAREIRMNSAIGYPAVLLFVAAARHGLPSLTAGLVAAVILSALAYAVLSGGRFTFIDAAATVFGCLYTGFLFGFAVSLRELGFAAITLVFAMTFANDTLAYFVGRAFGKHKLAPRVSPKKSVEGAVGGLVAAMLAGALGASFVSIPVWAGALLGAVTGVVGPLGDLAESAVKRWCGVKDSGTILPGHGGVLDRFDSLLFVAPSVYYLLLILIH